MTVLPPLTKVKVFTPGCKATSTEKPPMVDRDIGLPFMVSVALGSVLPRKAIEDSVVVKVVAEGELNVNFLKMYLVVVVPVVVLSVVVLREETGVLGMIGAVLILGSTLLSEWNGKWKIGSGRDRNVLR